ncbi:hypothetical protein J2Z42_000547 [Clostridium algifaecis]|uniref:ABC transporter permease n=1 Tax=Clostridium algifaecis TaxID=1472040 RepID=A0ABS4KPC4_9CLOT|nr:hypothetical protein [Clostridium algifaecis]MBP2031882.1 hypothetical protein [Clostridium algifaecis]
MFKLVKYDLMSYYKDFLIMVCSVLLLNLALCTRIGVWKSDAIFSVSLLISFAASVVTIIWNLKVFSRDIYEDSGYLLFTLPKSGYSILASKIITSILQCLIVAVTMIIITFLWVELLKVTSGFVLNTREVFNFVIKNTSISFLIFIILGSLVSYILFLLTVYLAITLSKVAIKNRKLGKFGSFVIFVILVIIQSKLADSLANIFPQSFVLHASSGRNAIEYANSIVNINIAVVILAIAFMAGMFYAASYLIENKLDL